ncbi:hypothetical protein DL769_006951 [Monosporascus sp. CRB-8-3]|nr:hypothetical protein DL769_006951 [Monosporascus sp. CRB-8-3]
MLSRLAADYLGSLPRSKPRFPVPSRTTAPGATRTTVAEGTPTTPTPVPLPSTSRSATPSASPRLRVQPHEADPAWDAAPTKLAAAAGARARILRTRTLTRSLLDGVFRIPREDLLEGRDDEDEDDVRGVRRALDSSTGTRTLRRRDGVLACAAPALLLRVEVAPEEEDLQLSLDEARGLLLRQRDRRVACVVLAPLREKPQTAPSAEGSDSGVFVSTREYPTPEEAVAADDRTLRPSQTPRTNRTASRSQQSQQQPDRQTDADAGHASGVGEPRVDDFDSAPTPQTRILGGGGSAAGTTRRTEALRAAPRKGSTAPRPQTVIANAGIGGSFAPLRLLPRSRATPSAGSVARRPRSASRSLGIIPTRTTRRPGGGGGQRHALRTRPRPESRRSRSRSTPAPTAAKSLRHAASSPAVGSSYDPSAGTRTITRVNGAASKTIAVDVREMIRRANARGGSVNYMSTGAYGEELFPANIPPPPPPPPPGVASRRGPERPCWVGLRGQLSLGDSY